MVNWNTCPGRPHLKAVAAILQKQTSAIVTTKQSGLARPRDLDGRVYASYAARFEGRIVQRMIINDGGSGAFVEETPPMLGIFDTILAGKADATWVFMGWEGVHAQLKGVDLNVFYPQVCTAASPPPACVQLCSTSCAHYPRPGSLAERA